MQPPDLFEGLHFPSQLTYRPHRLPGGRELQIPVPELRTLQKTLLRRLQRLVRPSPHAYAVRGRGPVRHALRHAGKPVVVTADLKDFFGSVGPGHLAGALPLGEQVVSQLFQCCLNGEPPRLPQGAPTSPYLAELAMVRLDQRLAQAAERTGWLFSRYVDDLAWSAATQRSDLEIEGLLAQAQRILAAEYLVFSEGKTKVMRPWDRQEVVGLVVNRREGALAARPGQRRKKKLRRLEKQGGAAEASGVHGYYRALEVADQWKDFDEEFE